MCMLNGDRVVESAIPRSQVMCHIMTEGVTHITSAFAKSVTCAVLFILWMSYWSNY